MCSLINYLQCKKCFVGKNNGLMSIICQPFRSTKEFKCCTFFKTGKYALVQCNNVDLAVSTEDIHARWVRLCTQFYIYCLWSDYTACWLGLQNWTLVDLLCCAASCACDIADLTAISLFLQPHYSNLSQLHYQVVWRIKQKQIFYILSLTGLGTLRS